VVATGLNAGRPAQFPIAEARTAADAAVVGRPNTRLANPAIERVRRTCLIMVASDTFHLFDGFATEAKENPTDANKKQIRRPT
jgi:hypothetical protein